MQMDSTGHVFVMHGDLLKLSCNEVLVPTDNNKWVESYWEHGLAPRRASGLDRRG